MKRSNEQNASHAHSSAEQFASTPESLMEPIDAAGAYLNPWTLLTGDALDDSSEDTSGSNKHDHIKRKLVQCLEIKLSQIMVRSHEPITAPCAPWNKKRKLETRERTFGSTMNTLERAYSAMLHEAFNYTVTSGIAQRVRELADNIRWKLHANVPDHEQEGWPLLKEC